MVDLVGVMGFNAAEAVVGEPGRDLQSLPDVEIRLVLGVEPAERRREEPDARRELQIELEAVEMRKQQFGRAPSHLGAEIGKGHGGVPRDRRLEG